MIVMGVDPGIVVAVDGRPTEILCSNLELEFGLEQTSRRYDIGHLLEYQVTNYFKHYGKIITMILIILIVLELIVLLEASNSYRVVVISHFSVCKRNINLKGTVAALFYIRE